MASSSLPTVRPGLGIVPALPSTAILFSELVGSLFIIAYAIAVTAGTKTTDWNAQPLPFIERDPALSYPKVAHQTVPGGQMIAIMVFVPIAIFIIGHSSLLARAYRAYRQSSKAAAIKRLRPALLSFGLVLWSFAQCIALNGAFTNTVKNYVGRQRPNFFALCDYAGYSSNMTMYLANTVPGAIGDISKCLAEPKDIEEAQLSFPSGHASYSFAGLFFATLYLRKFLSVPGKSYFNTRSVLVFGPTVIAGWIALTRIRDRYHNTDDVALGSAIGILSACLAWAHYVASRRHTLHPAVAPVKDAGTGKPAATAPSAVVVERSGSPVPGGDADSTPTRSVYAKEVPM